MLKFFYSSPTRVRCVRLLFFLVCFTVPFSALSTAREPTAKQFFELSPEKRLSLLVSREYYLYDRSNYSVAFLDSLAVLAKKRDEERLLSYIYLFRMTRFLSESQDIAAVRSVFERERDRVGECRFAEVRGLYKHYYGKYYDLSGMRGLAFQQFLAAKKEFDMVGYESLPFGGECLNDLGLYYYRAGYYEIALRYLERAVRCPFARPTRKISVLHSVGLGYRSADIRNYAKAKMYFCKSYKLARKFGDSTYCFVNTGEYGRALQLEGRKRQALAYLNKSLNYVYPAEKFNTSMYFLYKAEILLADIDLAGAKACMNKSDSLIKDADITYRQRRLPQHYEVRSALYRRTGEYDKVLAYNDSILSLKDSINTVASNRILEEFEASVNAEKYFTILSSLEAARTREIQIGVFFFICFLLTGAIIGYGFQQRRRELLKARKLDQKMKEVAEQKAARIIEMRDGQLMQIQEKNVLINKINSELAELKRRSERWSDTKEEAQDHIDRLLNSTIMTDADWEQFKLLFEKIHPGFLEKLDTKYHFLNASEIRLVTLIKLNVPSREMAVILGLTKDTIYTFKYRLRKKLELHNADFAYLLE